MFKKIYDRPKSILAFFLILVFSGLIALNDLSITLLPEIKYPLIIVETEYNNLSAEEIEKRITIPFEKGFSVVSGLQSYKSVSYDGKSLIYLFFDQSSDDMDKYYYRVKEKLEILKRTLPKESEIPVIRMFDPENVPFMTIRLDSEKIESKDIDYYSRQIESIAGVSQVNFYGIPYSELVMKLDQQKLALLKISVEDLIKSVDENNFLFPGGNIQQGNNLLKINIDGSIKNLKELENIIVFENQGTPVYLKDVASIQKVSQTNNYAVVNSSRVVLLEIYNNNDVNLYTLSDKIQDRLKNINVEYTCISDFSDYIERSLYELFISILVAVTVTFIVVFIFFRKFILSIIVSIVIPLSIIINFIFMFYYKISINVLSLSGLAVAVGIIVDNSIVITEKLFQLKRLGVDNYIIKTMRVTVFPLISSTMTTIIAFLPVIFLTGMTGEFYRQEAISISLTLIISLLLSFFLVPALFSIFIKDENKGKKRKGIINWIIKSVSLLTVFFFRRRSVAYLLVFSMVIVFLTGIFNWHKEFLPFSVEDQFVINIDFSGKNADDISFEVANLSEKIQNLENLFMDSSICVDLNEKKSIFTVISKPEYKKEVFERLKEYFRLRDIKADFIHNPSWNIPESFRLFLRLNIFHDDIDRLYKNIQVLNNEYSGKAYYKNIDNKKSIVIKPLAEKSQMYGVDPEELKLSVKANFGEIELDDINLEGKYIEFNIKNDIQKDLEYLNIVSEKGDNVYLKDFVELKEKKAFSPVYRKDGKRSFEYMFDIFNNIDENMDVISEKIKDKELEIEFSGINQIKDDMLKNMFFALIAAIFFVYLILVVQYESFMYPFYIMILIPASYSGSILFWYIFDVNLNLMSMLGLIILTGITVNNSIILLSEILRKKNIMKAVLSRSKAVFITTITTVIGSVPMLFGNTAEMRIPLAVTIIGGMSVSWIFSVTILPALFGSKNLKVIKNR